MSKYRKFIVALGAAASISTASLADGALTGAEISSIVIAFVGAGLVLLFPNEQDVVAEIPDMDVYKEILEAFKAGFEAGTQSAPSSTAQVIGPDTTFDGQPKRVLDPEDA